MVHSFFSLQIASRFLYKPKISAVVFIFMQNIECFFRLMKNKKDSLNFLILL